MQVPHLSVPTMSRLDATTGSSSTPSAPTAQDPSNLTGNDFITLLVAQLKSQDPTSPMDPTQFVNQLVSFNTLQQIIAIRQELAPPPSLTAPGALPATQTQLLQNQHAPHTVGGSFNA